MTAELWLREPVDPTQLNGCGMLVVNPPFGSNRKCRRSWPRCSIGSATASLARESPSRGSPMSSVMIIGAGAWGTALAIQAARAGNGVTLWARDPAIAQAIAKSRENSRLPGHRLPDAVQVVDALPASADAALLVVPMQHLRGVLDRLPTPAMPLVVCIKGVESGTLRLPAGSSAGTPARCPGRRADRAQLCARDRCRPPGRRGDRCHRRLAARQDYRSARHALLSPLRQRRSDRRPGRWRGEERDRHRGRGGDRARASGRTRAPPSSPEAWPNWVVSPSHWEVAPKRSWAFPASATCC